MSSARVTAHGVAPGDHFASGLALALREQWPALAKDFRHYCHTAHPKPGEAWLWTAANGTRIVSLLTQEPAPGERAAGRPGHAELAYLNHALRALATLAVEESFTSLAVPRLGTGVGGLAWEDVRPLVLHHLEKLAIPVYVYADYRKGQRADETAGA